MPKIIMKTTTQGSSDGIRVNNYVAGREYPVGDVLAKAFISMGVAEYVNKAKFVQVAPENKMINSSPDNKTDESDEPDEVIEKMERSNENSGVNKIIEEAAELSDKKEVLRVYQLADELGISSKKILRVAKKLGIFVSAPASGLSEEEAKRIKSNI